MSCAGYLIQYLHQKEAEKRLVHTTEEEDISVLTFSLPHTLSLSHTSSEGTHRKVKRK